MTHRWMISLANLSFSYDGPEQLVLHDLSLKIPTGSVTALLGPNGSGKTTLLSVILGVLCPQAGTILIDGKSRPDYTRRELSQLMGLVPQDESFPYGFTVRDYVLLGRAPHLGLFEHPGLLDRQAARDALVKTGLGSLAQRSLESLSGGERQLATIARALAQAPSILLLDEPTSHLDLANKQYVLKLVRILAREGVTVVFTTHDPNAAAAIADHVILMRGGRTIAVGAPALVLTQNLVSRTYGVPVQVVEINNRLVILTG